MKNVIIIIFLTLILSFVSCKKNNYSTWNSKYSDFELELVFDNNWELKKPIDNDDKVIVILSDPNDDSYVTVKIEGDFPKDILSDKAYFEDMKMHFLGLSENKLIKEDFINYKGEKYKRFVFLMETDFGDKIHTVYTYRNGKKVIVINFFLIKSQLEN